MSKKTEPPPRPALPPRGFRRTACTADIAPTRTAPAPPVARRRHQRPVRQPPSRSTDTPTTDDPTTTTDPTSTTKSMPRRCRPHPRTNVRYPGERRVGTSTKRGRGCTPPRFSRARSRHEVNGVQDDSSTGGTFRQSAPVGVTNPAQMFGPSRHRDCGDPTAGRLTDETRQPDLHELRHHRRRD